MFVFTIDIRMEFERTPALTPALSTEERVKRRQSRTK